MRHPAIKTRNFAAITPLARKCGSATSTMETSNQSKPHFPPPTTKCQPVEAPQEINETAKFAFDPAIRQRDRKEHPRKDSLTFTDLVTARDQTLRNINTKKAEEVTDEDRIIYRRAANRLSAFQSRQRRKMIVRDLQKTLIGQEKHNANQERKILELKTALQLARQENELLRLQIMIHAGKLSGAPPALGLVGQFATNLIPALDIGRTQCHFLPTMLENTFPHSQLWGESNPNLLNAARMTSSQSSHKTTGIIGETPNAIPAKNK